MRRLRYRLARWLVGPFVNLPERDGVFVVTRMDGGTGTMIVEADKFRLRTQADLRPRRYANTDDFTQFGIGRRTGRFVGTVKP